MDHENKFEALLAARARADQELKTFVSEARVEMLKRVKQICSEFDYTVGEVFGEQAKTTVPAKYRDPETGDEWSGRGKKPLWLKDKGDPDDYLIRR